MHTRRKQRAQLVAHLVLKGAKAPTEQVREARFEGERVPPDAIQAQLRLQHAPHLLGTAREDIERRGVRRAELTQQHGRARYRAFPGRRLDRSAQEILYGVELRAEVRLVEIPSIDDPFGREPQRLMLVHEGNLGGLAHRRQPPLRRSA